ncbi:MAG: hypothetical protein AB8G99_12780, partial [Planctomycetaceae bacterium]
ELRFALELAEKYKAIVELEVGAAYSLTKAGRIHQMVGEYNKAAACYIDAHERFTNLEAARRARRLTVVYDPRRLQPMGIDFLAELVSINKRLDEVRPFVTNAISIPETLGSATALKLLDEDPGNILETSSRCKLAYVDVLHSRHINMLKRQGWEQLIGQPIKNRGKFQQEFEENETAINIVQLLLTKDRTNHDYRIMGIRIQTDRARLELLRGKETEATIYLGNAARALGEWLIAQEAEEMRSALRAELAYVLCLAPKPIENVDVTADEVRTSLSSFSKRMKALIATDKRATRAKELARIADQRLAQYIEMQGRAN